MKRQPNISREEKRQTIRNAAAKLFAEQGFENTTTRDIAKAAGISNAALYYYFETKEDLLFQIMDEIITTGLEQILDIFVREMSPEDKLAAVLNLYAKYYSIELEKMKILVQDQKSLTSECKAVIEGKSREHVRMLVSILEDLKGKGEIVDLDSTVLAYTFFGMVHWAYRWYDPKKNVSPEQLSKIFYRVFTKGIFIEAC